MIFEAKYIHSANTATYLFFKLSTLKIAAYCLSSVATQKSMDLLETDEWACFIWYKKPLVIL